MRLGESFVGTGADAAHINTMLGPASGPVGTAWAVGLATPTVGHARFVVVARPGLAVQPMTLFVNKATIAGDEHARMTWGPAQAGVAGGVIDADLDPSLLLIAAVWVDPSASDAAAVYQNNRLATRLALSGGVPGSLDDARPWNPFFPL